VRGQRPRFKQTTAGRRTDSKAERGAAPQGARSQPGGRSRKGAWGNWRQARQPAKRGAEARLAAKEETCQAAQALLASVNAPGTTRSAWRQSQLRA